jgi:hypothetical protein
MTQTDEHDRALPRIEPARQIAAFPAIRGHRPPRLAVRLNPPENAAPLLQRVKDDYATLHAQAETTYQETVRTIQRQFAGGNMTPNERHEWRRTETAAEDRYQSDRVRPARGRQGAGPPGKTGRADLQQARFGPRWDRCTRREPGRRAQGALWAG